MTQGAIMLVLLLLLACHPAWSQSRFYGPLDGRVVEMTYNDAQRSCRSMGGELPSIHSLEELNKVAEYGGRVSHHCGSEGVGCQESGRGMTDLSGTSKHGDLANVQTAHVY